MEGGGEGDEAEVGVDTAAGVAGVALFDALLGAVFADFEGGDECGVVLFDDGEGVAEVVGVGVGEGDVVAGDVLGFVDGERVAGEERVDDEFVFAIIEEETGVAEEGDGEGHEVSPCGAGGEAILKAPILTFTKPQAAWGPGVHDSHCGGYPRIPPDTPPKHRGGASVGFGGSFSRGSLIRCWEAGVWGVGVRVSEFGYRKRVWLILFAGRLYPSP